MNTIKVSPVKGNIKLKYALNLLVIGNQPVTTTVIWCTDNNDNLVNLTGCFGWLLDNSFTSELQPEGIPVPIYQVGESGDSMAKDYNGEFIQFNVSQGEDLVDYLFKLHDQSGEVLGYWTISYPAKVPQAEMVAITTTGIKSFSASVTVNAQTVNIST